MLCVHARKFWREALNQAKSNIFDSEKFFCLHARQEYASKGDDSESRLFFFDMSGKIFA